MEQSVKKPTYYELHKNERKKYQREYRQDHLEEIQSKDRARKRKNDKGEPPVQYPLVFKENVWVHFS